MGSFEDRTMLILAACAMLISATGAFADPGDGSGNSSAGWQPFLAADSFRQENHTDLEPVDETGLVILRVFKDTPAERAGLKRGDVVLKVDGTQVNHIADVRRVLSGHRAGDVVVLHLRRGDRVMDVSVTLEGRLYHPPIGVEFAGDPDPERGVWQGGSPSGAWEGGHGEGPAWSGPRGGVPEMTPWQQQHNYSRVEVTGAQVLAVRKGMPADAAGLKPGDVVTAVDGVTVNLRDTLGSLIAERKPGDTVTLTVNRDNNDVALSATLADNGNGDPVLGVTYRPVGPYYEYMMRPGEYRPVPPRWPFAHGLRTPTGGAGMPGYSSAAGEPEVHVNKQVVRGNTMPVLFLPPAVRSAGAGGSLAADV